MSDAGRRPYTVLFLCTGNSARSIMAEAIMNRIGAPNFRAVSAGSMPTGRVNPHALTLLNRLNHPTKGLRSKSWEEFSRTANPEAPELDFVFTVCDKAAGEVCPIWPGQPITGHWGVPDPAAVTGSEAVIAAAFGETARRLRNRIELFLALPMAKLDRMSLQTKVREIGAPVPEAQG